MRLWASLSARLLFEKVKVHVTLLEVGIGGLVVWRFGLLVLVWEIRGKLKDGHV